MRNPGRLLRLSPSAAAFAALVLVARGDVEWRGTIVGPNGTTFALTDSATGESRWVPLRGRFGAFLVDGYDPQRQLLVLTRDGSRTELSLASARVATKAAPAAPVAADPVQLAQELAKRGDVQAASLLQQQRAVEVKIDDLRRRIAEAERATNRPAAGKTGDSAGEPDKAALATLTSLSKELEGATEQQAALTQQLQKFAQGRQSTATPAP